MLIKLVYNPAQCYDILKYLFIYIHMLISY
jgi:hypothetical protein